MSADTAATSGGGSRGSARRAGRNLTLSSLLFGSVLTMAIAGQPEAAIEAGDDATTEGTASPAGKRGGRPVRKRRTAPTVRALISPEAEPEAEREVETKSPLEPESQPPVIRDSAPEDDPKASTPSAPKRPVRKGRAAPTVRALISPEAEVEAGAKPESPLEPESQPPVTRDGAEDDQKASTPAPPKRPARTRRTTSPVRALVSPEPEVEVEVEIEIESQPEVALDSPSEDDPKASTPSAPKRPVRSEPLTPPTEAPTVLSPAQKVGSGVGLAALIAAAIVAPVITLIVVNAALVVFFMAANSMKVYLISRALDNRTQVTVDVGAHRTPDTDLPVYTILLPVFHEAGLLSQLVAGIQALDYPEDRLDVKLLLEEEDTETREAAEAMGLPLCFDVLIVPDVGPTGKPRACNYGLEQARGEFLVIFDAEDRPEADQLRKSVLAFAEAGPEVVCFQAQLNYFNRSHNLLTRWFAAEYSVWFDQLLPGLQAMDVVIPLGGTSNHFITDKLREIGGWNAFNVTEDADLGLRIYLQGWKTAVLDTTTYEEATSRYGNWIRQRSRWVKGYMQTYLYHMRHPVRLAREMGLKTFVAFQLFFGAGTLCLLLNPFFWLLAVVWFCTRMHWIQTAFPSPVLYLATIGLFVGNAACVLSAVSGCFGRRNYEDVKYAFLSPVYWVLMSVGAWKALVQLITKPMYWEKTEHGFCTYDEPTEPAATPTELTPVGALSAP